MSPRVNLSTFRKNIEKLISHVCASSDNIETIKKKIKNIQTLNQMTWQDNVRVSFEKDGHNVICGVR